MNKRKIAYYISTGLLSLLIVGGATMYFVRHEQVVQSFTALGYPTYLIYPMAVAKLLGLVAIWVRKSDLLKNLAYAGFFYNLTLAASAHIAVNDGEFVPALVGLLLLMTSFFTQRGDGLSKAS